MSAVVLSITGRQSRDVQRRAMDAVSLQRRRNAERWTLAQIMADGGTGTRGHASLDAWYRQLPIAKGRIGPQLTLSPDEKRLYGLPISARLVELRGVGKGVDHWSVTVSPVQGGYIVGVKAPHDGSGVGVLWRKSHQASDHALRLSAEHGFPIWERYV